MENLTGCPGRGELSTRGSASGMHLTHPPGSLFGLTFAGSESQLRWHPRSRNSYASITLDGAEQEPGGWGRAGGVGEYWALYLLVKRGPALAEWCSIGGAGDTKH